MAILLSPVLFIRRALSPIVTLQSPLMLLMSVSLPTAELLLPVSLLYSVKHPTPVLSLLVVLNTIAPAPFAVFLVPAVFSMSRIPAPSPVL